MKRSYPSRSRLLKKLDKQSRKNFYLAFLGIVLVIFAVFKIGIPLLVQASLFIGNFNSTPETQKENPAFLQAPSLSPLPNATNSATIKLTGFATPEKEVEIFVNNELTTKINTDKDGTFEIPDLKLLNGENILKARMISDDRRSEFSESLTVTFNDKTPTLEITNPTDNQTFGKDQGKIEVKGKTDPDNQIMVNDFRAIVDSGGNFSYFLELSTGENKIQIKARNLAGNEIKVERKVTFSP